ncbi:hypothetical protein SNOG_15206 [Parastagonospora nodorum SN15]|uniref:Killer toxin Kp4 domain-containing protein n=1 Tax=Phaeosphaeria nodorum (strain SN15 / ATCC MYA-4574 / FGSC 10173) TaxID=321614 RepID=Q0TZ70_PHANO|nr:hypothetical protein SNOG_15206 [Parastagonospora nodorum SN15]EAT77431.2 hypothetical protein SNOG_15206 [Parastagonospora nodorum SN15]
MKISNSFAKVTAFALVSALVATALPSNDNKEFKNYVLIACARCATEAERPADYKQGICAYATKLKPGTTVTGKVVKASIEALVKHGCERCGSVPVVPGAKDDTDGNVQINFTRGACETGLCQGKSASAVASEGDSAPSSEDEPTNPAYVPSETVPGISLRSDSPDGIASPDSIASPDNVLLGLNCRGSGMCNDLCFRKSIMELDIIMQNLRKFQSPTHPDHHNNYKNGEQIACRRCKLQKDTGSAICAFPQNLPEGADLDYDEIKAAMKAIVDHGCKCK